MQRRPPSATITRTRVSFGRTTAADCRASLDKLWRAGVCLRLLFALSLISFIFIKQFHFSRAHQEPKEPPISEGKRLIEAKEWNSLLAGAKRPKEKEKEKRPSSDFNVGSRQMAQSQASVAFVLCCFVIVAAIYFVAAWRKRGE